MLDIRVNNQSLDLKPGQGTRFVNRNPIFDRERINRSFTYPFTLDNTPNNLAALGYANRIDNYASSDTLTARVYLHGLLYEVGILKITNVNKADIEINIKSPEITLLEEIDKVKVRDLLDCIDIPNSTGQPIGIRLQIDPNETSFTLKIRGTVITQFSTNNGNQTIAEILAERVNNVFPGMANAAGSDQFVLLTSPDGQPIILSQFSSNITIDLNNPIIEAHAISFRDFVNDLRDNPRTDVAFPQVYNSALYSGTPNYFFAAVINPTDENGDYLIAEYEEEADRWRITYIPYVRIPHIVEKIVENSSLDGYRGDYTEREEFTKAVMNNYRTLDNNIVDYVDARKDFAYRNIFEQKICLRNHVHDMTAKEFIRQLAENHSCWLEVRENHLYLNLISAQLAAPAVDWTNRIEPEYNLTPTANTGYTLLYPHDPADFIDNDNRCPPFVYEGGAERITLPWGILPSNESTGRLRCSSQRVGDTVFPQREEIDVGNPRIFLFNEWQNDADGIAYPQSLSGFYIDDQYVSKLQFAGPDGLVANIRGLYDRLAAGRPLKKRVRLTVQDIINLRRWQFSRVRLYHEQGECLAVIKSFEFEADTDGIGIAEVEFIILQP